MKILYLMSVDWGWIVQRPHFLALELEKYYEVKVVYLKQYIKRWESQKKIAPPAMSKYGIYLPLQEKIPLLKKISDYTFRKAIGDFINYDAIVIGTPMMYPFIENYKGKVIYDCMDNYVALEPDDKLKQQIAVYENELLQRADLVLVSSLKLKKLVESSKACSNVVLVRNGYNNSNIYKIKPATIKNQYKIGYIGTISSWMNFELLNNCVKRFDNISFHLLGPAPGYETKATEKIIFEGMIEHSLLYCKIQDYDCLIMPFVLNDIILAVDPVKLYEYISFGKCIISVYYNEIARFSDYVYFYHNEEEFFDLINELSEKGFPSKYNEEQQCDFLGNNSWEIRGKTVDESIKHLWDKT